MSYIVDEGDRHAINGAMVALKNTFENAAKIEPLTPTEEFLRAAMLGGIWGSGKAILELFPVGIRPLFSREIVGMVSRLIGETGVVSMAFGDAGSCARCRQPTRRLHDQSHACLFCLESSAMQWAAERNRDTTFVVHRGGKA